MRLRWAWMSVAAVWALGGSVADADPCAKHKRFTLVVHGGAGTLPDDADVRRGKREAIARALENGERELARGAAALDVVEAAVRELEDSPLFNAGRGGIANKAGFVELDASIMDGRTRAAGAVAAVRTIKNPVTAARAVMEKSPHVLLVDRGAEAFARSAGIAIVDPSYFDVPRPEPPAPSRSGTVGAVALDRCGATAAATSTGGWRAKVPGRVGDSPLIGAGTYASAHCAVSATGHGEFFIRWAAAFDVCALAEYRGLSIRRAARTVIHNKLAPAGGVGGVIAIDARGRVAWPHSSKHMVRGSVDHRGRLRIGIDGPARAHAR